MEVSPFLTVVIVFAIVFITPVVLLRPLIMSIADRIAGKKSNADEVKALKAKVSALEQELGDMRGRLLAIEDSHDFSRRLAQEKDKERS